LESNFTAVGFFSKVGDGGKRLIDLIARGVET
jgi:hypothetical protein